MKGETEKGRQENGNINAIMNGLCSFLIYFLIFVIKLK